MDQSLVVLIAASVTFVGSHFVMSHPLRPALMKLSQGGFMAVYNIVSLAAIFWMVRAFTAAPPADLTGSGTVGWVFATIITLPAMVLLLGSLTPRNPAFPTPMAKAGAEAGPAGVFRVTRHPMMWGFSLWAISHIILWWSMRSVIVAIAILILALVGAHLQDRKKAVLMGETWLGWEAQTSYWPRWGQLFSVGWVIWAGGALLWLVMMWVHLPLGGIPAGVWRWL